MLESLLTVSTQLQYMFTTFFYLLIYVTAEKDLFLTTSYASHGIIFFLFGRKKEKKNIS